MLVREQVGTIEWGEVQAKRATVLCYVRTDCLVIVVIWKRSNREADGYQRACCANRANLNPNQPQPSAQASKADGVWQQVPFKHNKHKSKVYKLYCLQIKKNRLLIRLPLISLQKHGAASGSSSSGSSSSGSSSSADSDDDFQQPATKVRDPN